MMRGDFVTIAMQGDFGKPRPALVIQADQFDAHTTVTVLPVTSTLVAAPLLRITIHPSTDNGLQKPSQVMVDKAMTVKRDKVGRAFGRVDADALVEIERCLAVFLGIAK
ncbi:MULTISPECIES: type II toxin-antitoxin system PemK/MazF family toxin [Xanthomonas]|uniref:Type II toxin-antitoxin system PemK/MazF family toxin n=2 Tax=Xanthomonas TaxID=338 RepID=A0ABS8HIY5_9XANT|nr:MULTISPECIES: type II toxin-antitoxin system PemK/MazF family toxin [Xanthomonas]WVK06494.1 type II toxin-antitoxin system PemK/MazF family toxin [Xanthomonas campestris pv. olitorii]MBV6851702.1 type II toxin-antitoxin system PemK/MazF family toxin [Xanthomonas campestris pv. heliotropii]MBV6855937.1 type II toxin-antitoxin system PemK/MazF family toxin [Xanthomonas campestris pv. mirabilis]MBV6863867.1 type II toxin-antitoxin system PemK/MazF family toxin [Xanthomonas campestris pv. blepha